METRRSSRRLQSKSLPESSGAAKKRKSESPEFKSKTKVPTPKKLKVDVEKDNNDALVSAVDDGNASGSVVDKARHDSIEACVASAANVDLSSDSESESSDSEAPTSSKTPETKNIDDPTSYKLSTEEPKVEASEYFDFSQILSKQETYENLLSKEKKELAKENSTNNQLSNENVKNNTAKKAETKNVNNSKLKANTKSEFVEGNDKSKATPSRSKKSKKSRVEVKRSDPKVSEPKNDGELNVKDLLALGEGVDISDLRNIEEESESDERDYKIPDQVEITIDLPNAPKKKKGFDLEAALRRRLNLVKKENQIFVHKVHLLCLLSHGFHLNKCLNNENLIAVALSLIPSKHCYPPKHADLSYLEEFMTWLHKKISIEDKTNLHFNIDCTTLTDHLITCFSEHKAGTKIDLILMFIVIMRSLGLKCRLMINLQPEPIKPASESLIQAKTKLKTDSKPKETERKSVPEKKKNPRFENKKEKKNEKVSKYFQSPSSSSDSLSNYFKGKTSSGKEKSQPSCSKTSQDEDYILSEDDSDDNDFASPKKARKSTNKSTNKSLPNKKSSSNKKPSKLDRRVLSTDDECSGGEKTSEKAKKKKGLDLWCELFLEAEEKWISVDIINKRYHCVQQIFATVTHPVSYVLAWNNNNTVKDLTKRYATQWLTLTQKLRVEPRWWKKTLRPYAPPKTVWEREEDEELEIQLKDQPLPMNLSEYKNHPLYVLPKDLHKYQAIHPPDIAPVGFFRGEKVYPRSAVTELHTRETWLKDARVVRLGETPYKVVKARVQKDKFGFLPTEEKKSELFGIWQTEDYIPPIAQNGVVPRNSFGNVELYQASMLPVGTVHLQVPQLLRIARKLNIDCAPAMVGFEPCRFGSRPVMDGWVVCEEFRDVLLDAWNEENDEKIKKENEKSRKRAKSNWRKLFRILRIKKRLESTYNVNLDFIKENSETTSEAGTSKD